MAIAIIVAAGQGLRMKARTPKQFIRLSDRPILGYTLDLFLGCSMIDHVVVVVPETDLAYCHNEFLSGRKFPKTLLFIAGGKARQDSVFCGLSALEKAKENDIVVIHDGVRPFVTFAQLEACILKAEKCGACTLGIPATDTLKYLDKQKNIKSSLDRTGVWLAQTPQAFHFHLIKSAHENARAQGHMGTDDASLVERLGVAVTMIKGSLFNLKITTPEDHKLASVLMGAGWSYAEGLRI
jgi:2-C-methyl-D-erythritol 4-phosphate cytidylyltransferase